MYRMKNLIEILLASLLIFLVIGQPHFLRKFTKSLLGKVVFLVALVLAGGQSMIAGALVAIIYFVLRKDFMLIEGMENADDSDSDSDGESNDADDNNHANDDDDSDTTKTHSSTKKPQMTNADFVKKFCKDGKVDESMKPPTLKYTGDKCNPCDDSCEFEITSANEQMTVDEALRPKESNSIPV